MTKILPVFLSTIVLLTVCGSSFAIEPEDSTSVTWDISSLTTIGGHSVEVSGNPQVVSTDIGDAVEFDGDGDRLLVDNNPIGDAKEFTVEVYFKPADAHAISPEPRFIHIQDPEDPEAKRVMIELRLTEAGEWYLDGFMKTDSDDLPLIDESLVHPTENWMHGAITYRNDTFKTYVNGIHELTGVVGYNTAILNTNGKTSIGARMNLVNFYAGIVKTLKISHKALAEGEFLIDDDEEPTSISKAHSNNLAFSVYPNPAKHFVNVDFYMENQQQVKICLYNTHGAVVVTRIVEAINGRNNLKLTTNHLPSGIYMIALLVDGESYTQKIQL